MGRTVLFFCFLFQFISRLNNLNISRVKVLGKQKNVQITITMRLRKDGRVHFALGSAQRSKHGLVDDVKDAVCQGDVAYDDARTVDRHAIAVVSDAQYFVADRHEPIAVNQSR